MVGGPGAHFPFMNLVVIDARPCNLFETALKTVKLCLDTGDGDYRYSFPLLIPRQHLPQASTFALHRLVRETLNSHPISQMRRQI